MRLHCLMKITQILNKQLVVELLLNFNDIKTIHSFTMLYIHL